MRDFDRKVLASIAAIIFALALGGIIMLGAVRALTQAAVDVQRTHTAMSRLASVVNNLNLAQNGQRDFLLTADGQKLESCQDALFAVDSDLGALKKAAAGTELQPQLAELEPLLVRQVDFYKKTFEVRRKQGAGAAAVLLRREGSGAALERIQRQAENILQHEAVALSSRFELLNLRLTTLRILIALCGLAAAAIMFVVYRLVHKEMAHRISTTERLQRSLQEVNHLGELVEALQASQNMDEVCQTSGPLIKAVFQDMSGSLYLMQGPHQHLGLRYAFGDPDVVRADFSSQDCWGLRRGAPHLDNGSQGMTCTHLHADPSAATYCVPLMAQGQTIGLLSLVAPLPESLDERRQKLALVISEQISLALANLALRDKLKDQSILDPLTGLFNRRYMEETFERERVRHRDRKRAFGVAMADIDHFKDFNDKFGHEAGDHVLKEISNAMRRSLRPGDITCRFGGEELVLLLPEADLEQTRQGAEHCRAAVEKLQLKHNGRDLGPVTISIGIAAFPDDGDSIDALVKKADLGLYEAKHGGRNLVRHFEGGLPTVHTKSAA